MCGEAPVTVYLRWPERDLLTLSPLVRLLWGSLIDEPLTTCSKKQGRGCAPALLLVDEAGRTSIPMLADQATTVVGRKIYLWISIQSLSQLETVYGKSRADTLRNNMETQIYHRFANIQTAKYLEDRLGLRSAYARSKTLHHSHETTSEGLSRAPHLAPFGTSHSPAQRQRDHRLPPPPSPPFRAKRVDWRRMPILTREAEPTAACSSGALAHFKACLRLSGRKSRGDGATLTRTRSTR